ncbi:MAG TPA: flagellar biosynthesis anti-sigma factor FlgM [Methylophilus sp.]|nr:flagellar biosynthesis anti-sigma factor FlgM [Methylophilus sp.]HQQ32424.1 flagellar biosynthesis anti-sigma factor FlgM [Methylophilus sp.]
MKINDPIKKSMGLETERLGSNASKKAEKSVATTKSSESVTLSPLSAQLQSLEANVAAAEVFDAGKVEAIKSAIANGQFKVDSGKVADGLISTVKDLLSTQKT